MDGRNSAGRKISLLNDSCDVTVASGISSSHNQLHHRIHLQHHQHNHNDNNSSSKIQLPPLLAHASPHAHPLVRPLVLQHSRTSSSCSTSPGSSPQTPQLSRSSSSDSRAFSTPSPVTPSFESTFNTTTSSKPADPSAGPRLHYPHHLHQSSHHSADPAKPHHAQHYYLSNTSSSRKMDDPTASLYPPLPELTNPTAYGIPPPNATPIGLPQQTTQRSSNSPASEPSRVSTVSAASNSKGHPKKNQYPCPLAKQFNCSDFFTTSGHAARHAKKHTGKKDAFCPECNKAFTRKDNMEQHRRTHQNGRGASRSSAGATDDSSKVKKPSKHASKKSNVTKSEPALEAAVQQELADQQIAAAQAAAQAQAAAAQIHAQSQPPTQPLIEPAMMMPLSGPYFLGGGIDTGPIPALPMAVPDLALGRPPLHRTTLANNVDFISPGAPLLPDDALHYSYPSPGLSNGLNSLALAASEHQRRQSEEKSSSHSPAETPSQETPSTETP